MNFVSKRRENLSWKLNKTESVSSSANGRCSSSLFSCGSGGGRIEYNRRVDGEEEEDEEPFVGLGPKNEM